MVQPLPKMKIVVKSTKTISFDDAFDDDESSEHENNESDVDGPEQEQAHNSRPQEVGSKGVTRLR